MTIDDDRWVLVNREGIDTVHKNPHEECNLDDTRRDEGIDEITAERLLLAGDAVPCKHCLKSWG